MVQKLRSFSWTPVISGLGRGNYSEFSGYLQHLISSIPGKTIRIVWSLVPPAESRGGAESLGSGGLSFAFVPGLGPAPIYPIPPFARRTGHAVFPYPALQADHTQGPRTTRIGKRIHSMTTDRLNSSKCPTSSGVLSYFVQISVPLPVDWVAHFTGIRRLQFTAPNCVWLFQLKFVFQAFFRAS